MRKPEADQTFSRRNHAACYGTELYEAAVLSMILDDFKNNRSTMQYGYRWNLQFFVLY